MLENYKIQLMEEKKILPTNILTDRAVPPKNLFASDVVSRLMAFEPCGRVTLQDALHQLEYKLKKIGQEKEIRMLCSVVNPSEVNVDRLCQLFREEGINLNCSAGINKDTPFRLLSRNLIEGKGHGRSLKTLLGQMREKMIQPERLGDKIYYNSSLRNKSILYELCTRYRDPSIRFGDLLKLLNKDDLLCEDSTVITSGYSKRKGFYGYHILLIESSYINEDLVDFIQIFKEAGFDINAEKNGQHPFHSLLLDRSIRRTSIDESFINVIRKFIECGYEVNTKDSKGYIALHLLCQYYTDYEEETRESKEFLGDGAFPTVIEYETRVNYNFIDVIKLFLESGFDVNETKDDKGKTALQIFCEHNKHQDIMHDVIIAFLNYGFNANNKDCEGKPVLHVLCEHYSGQYLLNIIETFIKYGYDVKNMRDSNETTILHILCRKSNYELVIGFIELMTQNNCVLEFLNVKDKWETSPVYNLFCFYGEESDRIIRKFVSYGVNLDDINKAGGLPLQELVWERKEHESLTKIIEILIQENVNLYVNNSTRNNLLHPLCFNGMSKNKARNIVQLIKFFLDNGADVNAKGYNASPALHLLCSCYEEMDLIDAVQIFIDFKVDLKVIDAYRKTALHHLCENYTAENLFEIALLMIQNGVDINAEDFNGDTAFHRLCENFPLEDDLYEISKRFIARGYVDNYQVTSFHLRKNRKVHNPDWIAKLFPMVDDHLVPKRYRITGLDDAEFDKLLDHFNITGFRDFKPRTLYYLCCNYEEENLLDIIEAFILNGYNFNTMDTNERTPIFLPLFRDYRKENLLSIAKTLFNKGGAYIHLRDNQGYANTALHLLCLHYDKDNIFDIIKFFISCGADPNDLNKKQMTPLHCLCSNYKNQNQINTIEQFLFIKGVDPKITDWQGRTALHYLCDSYTGVNLKDVAELLIRNGMDPNIKDDVGKTALHLLCEKNKNEEVLIETIQLFLRDRFDFKKANDTINCTIFDHLQRNKGIQNKTNIERYLAEI